MQSYIDSGEKGYERVRQKRASLFYKQAMEEKEEFQKYYEKDVNKLSIFSKHPELKQYIDHYEERNSRFYHRLDRILTNEQNLIHFSQGYQKYGLVQYPHCFVYKEWAPEAKKLYIFGDFNEWDRENCQAILNEGIWETQIEKISENSKLLVTTENKIEKIPCWIKSIKIENERIFGSYEQSTYQFKNPKSQNMQNYKMCYVQCFNKQLQYDSSILPQYLQKIKQEQYNCIILKGAISHLNNQVIAFFAPNGSQNELKQFIDVLHENEITVILDFPLLLYNQSPIVQFDSSQYHYFTQGTQHPRIDYENWELNRYLLSSLQYWLTEYNFDGFRFSHLNYIVSLTQGVTEQELLQSVNCNMDALIFLMLANDVIHRVNQNAITIATELNYPGQGTIKEGGLGFDFVNPQIDS